MMTHDEMIERLENRESDIFDLEIDLMNFRGKAGRNWTKRELTLISEAIESLMKAREATKILKEIL